MVTFKINKGLKYMIHIKFMIVDILNYSAHNILIPNGRLIGFLRGKMAEALKILNF